MGVTIEAMRMQRDVHHAVLLERNRQVEKWGYDHDRQHTDADWYVLVGSYMAKGDYVAASALCEAAEEARRMNAMYKESGHV